MGYKETKLNSQKWTNLRTRGCIFILRNKYLVAIFFGCLNLCFILHLSAFQVNQVSLPDWIREEDYPPFEPDLHEDFPTGVTLEPRIPHILHQAYIDKYIPKTFASNIKRFLEINSDWKYHLWTQQSSRKLIIKRHPSLLGTLTLQMNFKGESEIFRYVVLYEFGGVYADIPIKWLRRIQKLTLKYSCIFTTLPFERASLSLKKPYLLNNDLVFCRAKHPFLKQIIDDLPSYQPMTEKEDSSGPHFVTSQFMKYNKQNYHTSLPLCNETTNNSPYFYKSKLPEMHEDAVFVPNSKYFSANLESLYVLCDNFMHLSFLEKRGCVELVKRRGINKFAFTYIRRKTKYESVINFLFKVEISYIAGDHLNVY